MKEIDKTYSQLAGVTEQLAKMAAEEDAAAALAELVIQELEQQEGNIITVFAKTAVKLITLLSYRHNIPRGVLYM